MTLPYDFLTLLASDFQLKLDTKEVSNPLPSLPDTDYLTYCKEKANLANMNNVYQEEDEKIKKNSAYTLSYRILLSLTLRDLDEIMKHIKEQDKETASMNNLYQALDAERNNMDEGNMDKEIKDNLYQAIEEFKKRYEARREFGMIFDSKTVRNYVVKFLRVIQGELNENNSQKFPFSDIFFLKLFSIENNEQSIKSFFISNFSK